MRFYAAEEDYAAVWRCLILFLVARISGAA